MELDTVQQLTTVQEMVLAALQKGLPLTKRPYAKIAERIGLTEAEVLLTIRDLRGNGIIRRFGVVVNHHRLGYRANAMSVWNIPNSLIAETGEKISKYPFVNLCYERERHFPDWPYNLYCMIHGKDRKVVESQIAELRSGCGIEAYPYAVLFSTRRYKQRSARYFPDEVRHG